MANGDLTQALVIIGMIITLSVVTVLELRVLRKRRQKKLTDQDLPDRAHNAIITAKAIATALARSGVESEEAASAIKEAQTALKNHHYRVAIEMSDKAKSLLSSAKARREREGDVAKLDRIASKGKMDEQTAKERLMKELPENFTQSKFSMNLANEEIAAAKLRAVDVTVAERHMVNAQASFDAKDYAAALRHAVRARRSLESPETPESMAAPEPEPQPAATGRACGNCGASVAADDTFCRKCGTGFEGPRLCPSCGAEVAAEDSFCRKCGTRFP